jgi:hypothetical protein
VLAFLLHHHQEEILLAVCATNDLNVLRINNNCLILPDDGIIKVPKSTGVINIV